MSVKDGDWTLVEWCPELGRSVWHYFDGVNDHYRTDYDVTQVIDKNRELRNNVSQNSKSPDGIGQHIASIPINLFFSDLMEANEQGDSRYINQWLGENNYFKVR